MDTDEKWLLEVRNLKKYFPVYGKGLVKKQIDTVKAVDDVSFKVRAGETLGIVGESSWLMAISLGNHLHSFSVGVLDSGDIAWFVAGMMACIGLAWRVLEAQRWA